MFGFLLELIDAIECLVAIVRKIGKMCAKLSNKKNAQK